MMARWLMKKSFDPESNGVYKTTEYSYNWKVSMEKKD